MIPIQLASGTDSRENPGAMTLRIFLSALVFGGLLTSAVAADKLEKRKSPKGAKAYIISPKDGKTVGKKFTVRFGLKGMGVAPAGIDKENTGHHHLLIDTEKLPNLEIPLAATEKIRHFGGGQTEVTLELPPGKHTAACTGRLDPPRTRSAGDLQENHHHGEGVASESKPFVNPGQAPGFFCALGLTPPAGRRTNAA